MTSKSYEWWSGKPNADDVLRAYQRAVDLTSARRDDLRLYVQMYGNRHYFGYGPVSILQTVKPDRLTMNVVKSATDTVTNKIAQSKPRPRFLTSHGNWSLRRKARLLERWVDTQFYTTNVHRTTSKAFLDACVTGDGFVKVYCHPKDDRVCVERVFPGDIVVDPMDGLYGDPRCLYQVSLVPRSVLARDFPASKAAIAKAPSVQAETLLDAGLAEDSDRVEVIEAWHLPTNGTSEDGRHVIVLQGMSNGQTTLPGAILNPDTSWDRPNFPIFKISWTEPLRGYYGQGLADELLSIQSEINKILMKVQKSMHLFASPQLWVSNASGIAPSRVNNKVGAVGTYNDKPPLLLNPPVMPPDVYQHLDRLYNRALELAGISLQSMGGKPIPNLESGEAYREYEGHAEAKFALKHIAWDNLHMDIAREMVACGRALAKRNPKYKVVANRDKWTIDEVGWGDVDLGTDAYVLKVFPSSSLPPSPTGRLAYVDRMLAMGVLTPPEAKRLLQFPDVDAEVDLETAATENIDRVVEKMLDEGEYEAPEPFIDRQLALKRVQAHYQMAVNAGVPEDRLDLLRMYQAAVHDLELKAQAATQLGPQAMEGAMPPANGMSGQPMTAAGGQPPSNGASMGGGQFPAR